MDCTVSIFEAIPTQGSLIPDFLPTSSTIASDAAADVDFGLRCSQEGGGGVEEGCKEALLARNGDDDGAFIIAAAAKKRSCYFRYLPNGNRNCASLASRAATHNPSFPSLLPGKSD